MNKLSKQKQNQLVLIGLGTAIICVAIYFLVIAPAMDEMETVAKGSKELIDKITAGERDAKLAPLIQTRYAATTNLLRSIEAPMASGDMYSWIIQTMLDFGQMHKEVNIPQVSKETLIDVEMFPKYPYQAARFTVKGTGRFADIGAFVADFENHYQFFRIQNMELYPSARNLSDDPEKLDFTLDIVALVKPTTP